MSQQQVPQIPKHILDKLKKSWANPPEGLKPINFPQPGENK